MKYIYKFQNDQFEDYKSFHNFKKVVEVVENWEKNIENIKIMENYNIFISKENENINEINSKLEEYSKKIFNYDLKYLDSNEGQKEYSNHIDSKTFQLAEEILKLKNSVIFLKIFKKIKKIEKKKKNIATRAKDEFLKLKKLFADSEQKILKELKSNKDALKFLIEINSENENILIEEIDWLKNYFNINYFSHKEFLIEKIKIYMKNQSIYKILSGILKFFDIFRDIFDLTNQNNSTFVAKITEFINKYKSIDLITFEESEKNIKYLDEQLNISKYTYISKIKEQKLYEI